MIPLARRVHFAIAGGVTLVGVLAAGAGPKNGDAAVYVASALNADLTERTVHAGYLAIATVLGLLVGDGLLYTLDVLSAVSAGLAVLGVGELAKRHRCDPAISAVVMAICVVPFAGHAEVDLPLAALLVWAAAVRDHRAAAALTAAAVLVSPVALISLPWLLAVRPRPRVQRPSVQAGLRYTRTPGQASASRDILLAAAGTVALVSLLSMGGWWTGERGVLTGSLPRPDRTALAWLRYGLPIAALPAAWLAWRNDHRFALLWALPLLLVPADVVAWLPASASLALAVGMGWSLHPSWQWLWTTLLGIQMGVAGLSLLSSWDRVTLANSRLEQIAAYIEPTDGIVAPWHLGARLSILVTGDPYGLRWRTPDGGVRDQAERWCADPPNRTIVLTEHTIDWEAAPVACP